MYAAIGERYAPKLRKSLEIEGFQPVFIPQNPCVDTRLAAHADLSVIKLSEDTVILAKYLGSSALVNLLTNIGYKVIISKQEQAPVYPMDTNLCACIVGKYIIHNLKNTDPAIIENLALNLIDVKQSYSKCSICAVNENAIITADSAIEKAALSHGLDVLKINSGGIILDGFDEGFIGGASFAFGDKIYFTGLIDYSYRAAVERFIAEHGKKTVYLTTEPVFDIGGAVIL